MRGLQGLQEILASTPSQRAQIVESILRYHSFESLAILAVESYRINLVPLCLCTGRPLDAALVAIDDIAAAVPAGVSRLHLMSRVPCRLHR